MKTTRLLPLLLLALLWSCAPENPTEKHQKKRGNVVDVRDKIQQISTGRALLGHATRLYVMDKYLIAADGESFDKLLYVFDKRSLALKGSAGDRGPGPQEITSMGYVGIDLPHRKLHVLDHGKLKILTFDLDSLLADRTYLPHVRSRLNAALFPSEFVYINDSVSMGRFIQPLGTNDFKPVVARWNMQTGDIVPMPYEHPAIQKKRSTCAISPEHNLYAECYGRHDLLTLCTLDGSLKCNVYGPGWNDGKTSGKDYFGFPIFCRNCLVVPYSGKEPFYKDDRGQTRTRYSTLLQVFDLDGNYLCSWETGLPLIAACYDADTNRLFLHADDEIQFSYLSLNGLIK